MRKLMLLTAAALSALNCIDLASGRRVDAADQPHFAYPPYLFFSVAAHNESIHPLSSAQAGVSEEGGGGVCVGGADFCVCRPRSLC